MKAHGQVLKWVLFYLLLLLAPLALLLWRPLPSGGFWWDAAVALGFAALAMLVMQFFLTARLRMATAPFGVDLIYYFHRFFAYGLMLLVILHPLLLLWQRPGLWASLHPWQGDWSLQSGLLALLAMLIVMVTSVWRKALGIAYQHWRRLHFLLSLLAVALSYSHLHAISFYSADPWVKGLWTLIGLVLVGVLVKTHLLRPWRLMRRPWRVIEVRPEMGGCCSLILSPQGHQGLDFMPGQFAWISLGHTPFSLQEHPFSIASAPQQDGSLTFTIKALGDFSSRVPATTPGALAYVDGPYGVFSCDRYPQAPGYVFMGGGIGIAPMIGMLEALALRGDRRPHLLFAAHSRWDRIPRREEIVALARQLNLTPVPVLEEPPPDWQGERGWMDQAMLARYLGPEHLDHEYFLCGPPQMTQALERHLRSIGVPLGNIHTELFSMA